MAAYRRSTWRLLAAVLLLVTVPAAGSIPALPPPLPKADLVSVDLVADVANPRFEILVLVILGWDDVGNRTSLTAHVGGQTLTTSYAYDALNRLDTVTDRDGRIYSHGYDANGNRASLTYPNGVATTYQYKSSAK